VNGEAFVGVAGIAFGALVLWVAVRGLLRRSHGAAVRSVAEPRSLVRVLRTDDEVRGAVERALANERVVSERLQRRLDRYLQARTADEDALAVLPLLGAALGLGAAIGDPGASIADPGVAIGDHGEEHLGATGASTADR
jgi:hypothetical protein